MAYRPPNLPPPLPRGEVEAAFARAALQMDGKNVRASTTVPNQPTPERLVTLTQLPEIIRHRRAFGRQGLPRLAKRNSFEIDGEIWVTIKGAMAIDPRYEYPSYWKWLIKTRRGYIRERGNPDRPGFPIYAVNDLQGALSSVRHPGCPA